MAASWYDHTEVVRLLLEYKAEVNLHARRVRDISRVTFVTWLAHINVFDVILFEPLQAGQMLVCMCLALDNLSGWQKLVVWYGTGVHAHVRVCYVYTYRVAQFSISRDTDAKKWAGAY